MIGKPVQETHYNHQVWVSPIIEALRRSECLCWNCGKMKPGKPDHCPTAQKLYDICVSDNVATPVTRCPQFQNYEAEEPTTNEC